MKSESEIKEKLEYWQRRLEKCEEKTRFPLDEDLNESLPGVAAALREAEKSYGWIEALEWVLEIKNKGDLK